MVHYFTTRFFMGFLHEEGQIATVEILEQVEIERVIIKNCVELLKDEV